MIKPIWALAGVALLGTAGVAGALVVASSGGEEEVAQQVQTATPEASATTTPTLSPQPSSRAIPPGWLTYVDPVLGFSLAYPHDLVVKPTSNWTADATPIPLPEGGLESRNIEFRSPSKLSRAFLVSVFVRGTEAYTIDQFADEFFCLRDKRPGTLADLPAIHCTGMFVENEPESLVVAAHGGRFYVIDATQYLSPAEVGAVLDSFAFGNDQ